MTTDDFGTRLKKARKSRKMTQDDVSAKLGICTCTLRAWENGRNLPNVIYLKDLCLVLNVSANYLLGLKVKN